VIKQVWSSGNGRCSGNKANVIRWSNKFDQVVLRGSRVIKQKWSGDKTNVNRWEREHLPLPLDQTYLITWSHLFYYTRTFQYHLIKLVLFPDQIFFLPDHLPLPLHQTCFLTCSHLFYHLITFVLSPENLSILLDQTCLKKRMWAGDKTNVIKW
jgi:hypothetical protein